MYAITILQLNIHCCHPLLHLSSTSSPKGTVVTGRPSRSICISIFEDVTSFVPLFVDEETFAFRPRWSTKLHVTLKTRSTDVTNEGALISFFCMTTENDHNDGAS
ncbi:unnamed protein product [Haemonchus placei]|uniref:Uncharacterized protein n=1 Tax=Haemonchus placei TaxID=6290 RepID=A0A3P7Y8I8_HAEPC|nr:unnamed protein product [Haemonchus placei]